MWEGGDNQPFRAQTGAGETELLFDERRMMALGGSGAQPAGQGT
jgi:hypothetical protein